LEKPVASAVPRTLSPKPHKRLLMTSVLGLALKDRLGRLLKCQLFCRVVQVKSSTSARFATPLSALEVFMVVVESLFDNLRS
jgi:hypothetical protein